MATEGQQARDRDLQTTRVLTVRRSLLREANEHIEELGDEWLLPPDSIPLLCECGHRCVETIEVSKLLFDSLRSTPNRYVVKDGHEDTTEKIVERRDGYVVIDTDSGENAEYA